MSWLACLVQVARLVRSIRTAGRYTVVVTLTHSDASWQYTPVFGTSEIFEMKFAQAHKGSFGKPGTLVMGSGPWKIATSGDFAGP